jgi:hypothetical protein
MHDNRFIISLLIECDSFDYMHGCILTSANQWRRVILYQLPGFQ